MKKAVPFGHRFCAKGISGLCCLDELVEQVFQVLLATGADGGLTVAEGVGAEVIEGDLIGLDLGADAGVPGIVALGDELGDATVGTQFGCGFQAASKGIHAADVGVEEILGLMGLTTTLGIEVETTSGESAHFEDFFHDAGGEVKVGGELVGVPADELVALVGIDGAEGIGGDGNSHFMKHGMTGEGGVVCLQVELEVPHEAVFAEEIQARSGIRIVLVSGRFAWFWFDVELTFEANFFRVVDGHVQQCRKVIELTFHVGIEQGGVAFATAPEGVTFTAEFESGIHGGFHLGRAVSENVRAWRCASTLGIAWMGEQASGAPEEFFAVGLLQAFEVIGDFIERCIGCCEVVELRCDVAIVEAVVVDASFVEEFEKHVSAFECVVNGIGLIIPWHQCGGSAEGVGETIAHDVPIGSGEAHVIAHGFALDEFIGIVVLECERVTRGRAFVLNFRNVGEIRHGAITSSSGG